MRVPSGSVTAHIDKYASSPMRRFTNRTEAGGELAATLHSFAHRPDVIVLALPRGGVPVGFEVAEALAAPLDVFTVRKLGLPDNEEYAIGAVATGGITTIDWRTVGAVRISDTVLESLVARERRELARREHLYRGDRPAPKVTGRTVILVDDGVATGATMHAAVIALRTLQPKRIIVVAPVASREAEATLREVADACVFVRVPALLYGVGLWYEDFSQTTDAEVLDLLRRAAERSASPSGGEALARSS